MSIITSIFKPSDNSALNLENFVKLERESTFGILFEDSVCWDDHTWNIKGFESTTRAGKVNEQRKILFTQFSGLGTKIKVAKSEEQPFAEPFLSFVKAHITHRHNAKRKTKDNHMVTVRAYRYLYELLPADRKEIGLLTAGYFDRAAQAAVKREKDTSAYRAGVALAEIATLLQTKKLTPMAVRWKNSIPKSNGAGDKAAKNSKEAEAHRAKMLPKTDVLIYLAILWKRYDKLEDQDKPLLCITMVLLFAGFRIDEVLGLDVDCLTTDMEFNTSTGVYHKVMKIRVLAKKSGNWTTKKIPFSAQGVIKEAIVRLAEVTKKHRHAAKLLLQDQKYHKLAHLGDDELIDGQDIIDLIGASSLSNAHTVMKNKGVIPTFILGRRKGSKGRKVKAYRVGDIHAAVYSEYVSTYPDICKGLGNSDLRNPLWKLLTLRYKDEFSPKGAVQWCPLPISQNVTQDFFRGRDYQKRISKQGARIKSVFERYDLKHIDGASLSVHSHQFRHLLNTIMQEADIFEEHEIARYFLRNKVGDNAAYNHQLAPTNLVECSQKNIENVLAKLEISADQAKESRKKWPTLSYEDVLKDLDEIGCSHTTSVGACQHDYSQSPCEKHYQCLRQCRSYRRQKGNQQEIAAITTQRDSTARQLEMAQEDMADEFYGANKWVAHHQVLLEGCNQALSIESDKRYAEGDIVIVFPDGDEFCKVE